MQYQMNYELHEFGELSENFAARAANEYELLRCACKDANRVLLIREIRTLASQILKTHSFYS